MKKWQRFLGPMCAVLLLVGVISVCRGQGENAFRVEEAGLSLSLAGWDGYVYTRQLQGEGAELKNARPTDPEILREMEESNTYLLVRPTQEDGGDWELRLLCTKDEGPEHHLLSPEELMDLVHQLDTSGLMGLGFEWIERGLLVHPQTQMIRMEASMAGWIDCAYEVGYGEKRVTLGISYDVEKAGEEIRQRAEQTALSMRFDGLTERIFALEHGTTGTKVTIPVGWTWIDTEPEPGFEQTVFYNSVMPDTALCLSTIPMDQLVEQEEGADPTEYDEWAVIDDLVEGGGEEAFVGEHTDTVRQFGGKEYRWLEGGSVLDDLPVGLVFALRPENGILYGFQMTSTQASEAMADFEQILSDVEYPGQSEPAAEDAFRVEEAGLSLSLAGWDGCVYTRQLQGEGADMKNARPTDPEVLQFMDLTDTYLVVHPTQKWGEGWELRVSCTDNEFPDYNELPLERLELIGEARKQEQLAEGYEWSEYGVIVHPQTQLIVTYAVEEGQTVYTYEAGVGKSRVVLTITFDGDEDSQEEIQRAERTALSMWFDGLEESSFICGYENPEQRLTIPPGWVWLPEEQDPESVVFYKHIWPETVFSLVVGEPNDAPEEQTQDNMREWLQEMVEDEFTGEYTISARKYGRWEYHCVEGNVMVEGEQVPLTYAIRLDNGIVYVYYLSSSQMSEAMADFEQILSSAEYPESYGQAQGTEDGWAVSDGVVAAAILAAGLACALIIVLRRRKKEGLE